MALLVDAPIRLGIVDHVQSLRGRRLPWIAFAFGTGVGAYFSLPVEPGVAEVLLAGGAIIALLILAWLGRHGAGFLAVMAAVVIAGGLAAQLRSNLVAGPVLSFRFYGAIEGRIIKIDRSGSGAVRLTLDQVRMDRMGPSRTPLRVRLSLQDPGPWVVPTPGLRVMTTGHLGPPPGPVEPGGFDFQRHVWFQSLGALGYSRTPLLLANPASDGAYLAQLRRYLAEGLRTRMPGMTGEVAAAITTGDRSGLPDDVVEVLRASNLAHLLAISGLHMGLLVGFVFWTVRGGLALAPKIALSYPTRSWAAAVALPIAAFYLALSGSGIATQRAFIMAAVMLGAIIVGRRALSLRSVAMAALVVLLWRPESLTGPGFQMSFAATGALVLAFGWLAKADRRWRTGVTGALIALLVSSLVAGMATAPIAAAHFSRVGNYGLLANLLAVPAMGTLVMPLLFIGLILWPIGLEGPAFWLAAQGIEWIVWVATWVSGLPGSLVWVPAPPAIVLPLIGFGMVLFAVARTAGRLVAVVPLAVAAVLWAGVVRPVALISEDGRLAGVMSLEGRVLSHEKGGGFVAGAWLENDGDPSFQAAAAARTVDLMVGAPDIVVARGKRALALALEDCMTLDATPRWVVTDQRADDQGDQTRCRLVGIDELRKTGAIALVASGDGLATVTASQVQGARPWTGQGLLWKE